MLDALLTEVDTGLRTLATSALATRPSPAAGIADPALSENERATGAALMRVNHAGEVAAQALYRGQAFTTRDPEIRQRLHKAAAEEQDHLAWCQQRVTSLGSHTSLLGPLWYAGSFAIGAVAGLLGTSTGLGFVVETERQVEEHLSGHLDRLPQADLVSREIVRQIRSDEAIHGAMARELGGVELPEPARRAMRLAARLMTTVAHRL
ncbi:MAG: 2-polyprenyl-3-methyl-6-methoxy-1,4-benzoquinone monooxygenase [Gammaproteobacteria bacterium]|nr:2-polyprenyl-3-methyl-6-methoxy-1,4-benzoquinone monooxygenase [Gammaproteobacteria bacterium]